MNPTVKELWVAALAANPPQLTGYLGNLAGERCCLGVLCDIAVAEGIIPAPIEFPIGGGEVLQYGDQHGWNTQALPPTVMGWAGLTQHNPTIVDPKWRKNVFDTRIESLAELNDAQVEPAEIGAIIKEQL